MTNLLEQAKLLGRISEVTKIQRGYLRKVQATLEIDIGYVTHIITSTAETESGVLTRLIERGREIRGGKGYGV